MFLSFHSVMLCIVYLYHALLAEVTNPFLILRSTILGNRQTAGKKSRLESAVGERGDEKRAVGQHISCWLIRTRGEFVSFIHLAHFFHSTAFVEQDHFLTAKK